MGGGGKKSSGKKRGRAKKKFTMVRTVMRVTVLTTLLCVMKVKANQIMEKSFCNSTRRHINKKW